MNFWVKINSVVKWIFPNYIWDLPNSENKVFLTFDDGPTPMITEWVLEQLKKYNAKATFFCIGNNIKKHPDIFQKIIDEGHLIGNHTYNHLNGWKTSKESYLDDAKKGEVEMLVYHAKHSSLLFRPPYGKIKPSQSKALRKKGYKIIMWDVLSCDFDQKTSQEQCLKNVTTNVNSGSIIVFHDSEKAFRNLQYTLPKTLKFLKEKGYVCGVI